MPTAASQTPHVPDTCDASSLAGCPRVELFTPSEPPTLPHAVPLLVSHLLMTGVWLAIWQCSPGIWNWSLLLAALLPLRGWAARSRQRVASGSASSGLNSLAALIELTLASALLTSLGSDALSLAVFFAWSIVAVAAGWRYACERDRWSMARLSLGSDPTVPLPGSEEEAAGEYRDMPERMDRCSMRLNSFGPYGWLLVGIAALLAAVPDARLMAGWGAVWLAFQALRSALAGVSDLVGALVAMRCAARSSPDEMEPAVVETERGRTVVQGRDRVYRWYLLDRERIAEAAPHSAHGR